METIGDRWRLLQTIGDYLKLLFLLDITGDCWGLLEISRECWFSTICRWFMLGISVDCLCTNAQRWNESILQATHLLYIPCNITTLNCIFMCISWFFFLPFCVISIFSCSRASTHSLPCLYMSLQQKTNAFVFLGGIILLTIRTF